MSLRAAPLWAQITVGILGAIAALIVLFVVVPFVLGFCGAFLFGL